MKRTTNFRVIGFFGIYFGHFRVEQKFVAAKVHIGAIKPNLAIAG